MRQQFYYVEAPIHKTNKEDAVMLLYIALKNITKKWTMPLQECPLDN